MNPEPAALCSHCGAVYAAGVHAACRDCRLAPDVDVPPTLPADEEEGPDELVFDLADWPAGDRVALGVALTDEDVPWRWEAGPALVVREFDEAIVEAMLDQAEGEDDEGEWEDLEGEAADEGAQAAMGELFDAADRLMHSPWNGELVASVADLGAQVQESNPPFGIDSKVWEQVGELAAAVVAGAAEEDEVAVEDAARSLRDFLREYV